MPDLSKLSPSLLWQLFAQICTIPHPSYHEEQLAQYILQWAKQYHLSTERDCVGNILIRKIATPGMEYCTPIVLQAHLDMVPQKNSDKKHDFTRDAIQPYVENGWVKAQGTTLGADNGIGMASALAVLIDPSITHGPLEVLLTMTEEAGMEGAFGLQPNFLQGKTLINTDSEQEGEIYIGCAGGLDATMTLSIQKESLSEKHRYYQLLLTGLQGGHSGCDIHLGRGNANKLLARFLSQYTTDLDLRLIEFNGGTLRNAIPREAFTTIAVPTEQVPLLKERVTQYLAILQQEFGKIEPDISLILQTATKKSAFAQKSHNRLLALLSTYPNGVIRMSDDIAGIVETSLNLGVVKTEDLTVTLVALVRSQVETSKQDVANTLSQLAWLAEAKLIISGDYPGWKPELSSKITQLAKAVYEKLFNKPPKFMVIHAGLECGLFKKPYPSIDMVSIGPTIKNPHSPFESVNIESVEKYWKLLVGIIQAIAKQP